MSEHLPTRVGIAQVDPTTALGLQPNQTESAVEEQNALVRIRTLVAAGTAALTFLIGSVSKEQPAFAATSKVAEINSPINGIWGSAASGQANVHTIRGGGSFAEDLFGNGVDVKLNVSGSNLSFAWAGSWTSCGGKAGTGVKVAVKVDNEQVGILSYAHLDAAVTSGDITNGMVLAKQKSGTMSKIVGKSLPMPVCIPTLKQQAILVTMPVTMIALLVAQFQRVLGLQGSAKQVPPIFSKPALKLPLLLIHSLIL